MNVNMINWLVNLKCIWFDFLSFTVGTKGRSLFIQGEKKTIAKDLSLSSFDDNLNLLCKNSGKPLQMFFDWNTVIEIELIRRQQNGN